MNRNSQSTNSTSKKSKALDRHLEVVVPVSIYTELENIINTD